MGAPLEDAAGVEHQDLVHLLHPHRPVRDQEHRAIPCRLPYGGQQLPLGHGIQVRRGLVEHQQRGVPKQGGRHREPLPLAAGEPDEQEEDYQTVGGMVMTHLGRVPEVGDSFEWEGFSFEVVDMDGHRVDKVLVARTPGSAPAEDAPLG